MTWFRIFPSRPHESVVPLLLRLFSLFQNQISCLFLASQMLSGEEFLFLVPCGLIQQGVASSVVLTLYIPASTGNIALPACWNVSVVVFTAYSKSPPSGRKQCQSKRLHCLNMQAVHRRTYYYQMEISQSVDFDVCFACRLTRAQSQLISFRLVFPVC